MQGADVAARFAMDHSFLSEPVTVLDENGHRHTYCPPGNAEGCATKSWPMNYVQTLKSSGAKGGNFRYLWPIEEYVYINERNRIIAEVLANLRSTEDLLPLSDSFVSASERYRTLRPKRQKRPGKPRIEKQGERWIIFHPGWSPLAFDSFEEAVRFAKRYMVKKAA